MRFLTVIAATVVCAAPALAQQEGPTFIHNGVYVEDGGEGAAACTVSDERMRLQLMLSVTEEFMDDGAKNGEAYRGTAWLSDGAGRERRFEIDEGLAGDVGTGMILALAGSRYFDGGLDSTERGNAHIQGNIKESGDRLSLYAASWLDLGGEAETYIVTVDPMTEERSREDGSPVGDFIYCPDAEN
jgi:hypothetical protein